MRMLKTVTQIICNECGRPIEPLKGFIIQGNIYVVTADTYERAGLIGNAFPEPSEDGTIMVDGIGEVAYHKDCLYSIINPAILSNNDADEYESFNDK